MSEKWTATIGDKTIGLGDMKMTVKPPEPRPIDVQQLAGEIVI